MEAIKETSNLLQIGGMIIGMSSHGLFFGPFCLDLDAQCLSRSGEELHLRTQLFNLLKYLIENRDRAIPREELEEVLSPGATVSLNLVGTCIRELRKKLGDDPTNPHYVRTVTKRGYQFIHAVTEGRTGQVWNIPDLRTKFFTGREGVLGILRTQLQRRKRLSTVFQEKVATAVVNGLGGIGKTQTVLRYAFQYKDEYAMGFWIPSDSEEALVDGFHRIGSLLDVDVGDSEDPALAVKQWLEGSQDWLLIFDGADDPKLLKRFLPVRGKGHILITSRRQAFDDIGISKPGTITGLTLEEAVGFMLRRTGRGDLTDEEDRALRSMLTRIDGLPLALEQAGAYILRVRCSFGEYLSRYEARGLSLLERFPPRAPGYQESVATTWALNFEEIEKSSKATADVLRISAFLNSDSIPFKVFVGGAQAFGERTAKILRENEFDEVLEPALEYSLVAREIGALAFSVHPMVQEVLRGGMSESEESEWAKRVIRAVREVLSNPELDHWRPSEELIPSAVSCGKLIRERGFRFPEAIILMKKLATHLYLLARYSESESILSWVISNSRGDVDLAMCLNGVGMLSMKRKHYEEGENYFKQALALIIRTFGPESPEQAVVLDNLGQLYLQTRRYGEAETCLKTAFNLHEQNLVHCPESSRRYFGRLFADSFVALPRKTPGIPASRASLTTKIHPELTPRTSRTVH